MKSARQAVSRDSLKQSQMEKCVLYMVIFIVWRQVAQYPHLLDLIENRSRYFKWFWGSQNEGKRRSGGCDWPHLADSSLVQVWQGGLVAESGGGQRICQSGGGRRICQKLWLAWQRNRWMCAREWARLYPLRWRRKVRGFEFITLLVWSDHDENKLLI